MDKAWWSRGRARRVLDREITPTGRSNNTHCKPSLHFTWAVHVPVGHLGVLCAQALQAQALCKSNPQDTWVPLPRPNTWTKRREASEARSEASHDFAQRPLHVAWPGRVVVGPTRHVQSSPWSVVGYPVDSWFFLDVVFFNAAYASSDARMCCSQFFGKINVVCSRNCVWHQCFFSNHLKQHLLLPKPITCCVRTPSPWIIYAENKMCWNVRLQLHESKLYIYILCTIKQVSYVPNNPCSQRFIVWMHGVRPTNIWSTPDMRRIQHSPSAKWPKSCGNCKNKTISLLAHTWV